MILCPVLILFAYFCKFVGHSVAPPGFFLWGGRKGPVKMLWWHWHNTCCMPKSNGRQYFLALPLILSGSI